MPNAGLRDLLAQRPAPPPAIGARLVMAMAGLCLALGACQSTKNASGPAPSKAAPTASGGLKINEAEPFAGLRAAAQRQQVTPDAKAKAMAPPPGIEPADVALVTEGSDAPGAAPLDSVLAKFGPEV